MSVSTKFKENKVLGASALFAGFFAGGCLVAGTITGSLVILFDGIYSSVSLVLTLLSLIVANFVKSSKSKNLPFNKELLEPLVIAFKGLIILALVAHSLIDAVNEILSGGVDVNVGVSSLFSIVCVFACTFSWWWLCKNSKANRTNLIVAEIQQWKMDTVLNLAVAFGFICAWLLSFTPWAHLAGLVDPAMLCIMSFYLIKVPTTMFLGACSEFRVILTLEHNYDYA